MEARDYIRQTLREVGQPGKPSVTVFRADARSAFEYGIGTRLRKPASDLSEEEKDRLQNMLRDRISSELKALEEEREHRSQAMPGSLPTITDQPTRTERGMQAELNASVREYYGLMMWMGRAK